MEIMPTPRKERRKDDSPQLKIQMTTGNKMRTIKWILLGIGVILSVAIAVYLLKGGYVTELLKWVESIGWWGNIVLILIYIVISFPVPIGTSPLALCCGFLYGIGLGFATISIGSMLGSILSFWVCRKMFKEWVEKEIKSKPTLIAIMKAVETNSFKICFMVRSAPIMFGIQNALFAISSMKFNVYVVATWFGLFPEQLLLAYMGSTTKNISDVIAGRVENAQFQKVFVLVQAFFGFTILILLIFQARRVFNKAIEEAEKEQELIIDDEDIKI